MATSSVIASRRSAESKRAGVALGERGGPALGLVEQAIDAQLPLPVHQWLQVPLDALELGVGGLGDGRGRMGWGVRADGAETRP
jgi:hypothetical protein